MKILSFDPGKNNMAWALLEDGRCLRYGFIHNTLSTLGEGLTVQIKLLEKELKDLLTMASLSGKDFICAERYMHRPGMGMGAVSEYINISLGLLISYANPVEVRLITSALWKNHMGRAYATTKLGSGKVTELVTSILDPVGKSLTKHESDAIGIGSYCFDLHLKAKTLPLAAISGPPALVALPYVTPQQEKKARKKKEPVPVVAKSKKKTPAKIRKGSFR